MGTILALFGNVWVRRAGVALGVIGLLWCARSYYIAVGKDQGKQQAAQDLKDQSAAEIAKAREEFLGQLSAQNKLIESYASQLSVATQQTAAALQLAAQINKDRATAAGRVGALADADVHGFVLSTLNLRKPGDQTACYTPAEEREIALRVVDDPKCKQESDQNRAALDSKTREFTLALGQRNAIAANYDNLSAYTGKVEHAYVEIYNAFPRRRNWPLTIVTFGVKGKPKKLPFPDPGQLKGSVAK